MAEPIAVVAALDRQVERGSLFTQAVLQRAFLRLADAESILTRLVDVLAARNLLDPEELGVTVSEPEPPEPDGGAEGEPPAGGGALHWPTIALREDDPAQERADAGIEVDCSARMHICKAVCCTLSFPLSCTAVDAGAVKWDIGHPYVIRQEASGYCTHNDPDTRFCRVYDDRPGVCRRYSCARDTRIWKDFDNMVLNQEWIDGHRAQRDLRIEAVVPSMEAPVPVELRSGPRRNGAEAVA